MASITEQTRTQLIGLSVAMLGQAPGTSRLNHWVADIDDDAMSVDDLANHIAESEAFQSKYPAFLTSEEFASAFLGSLLHGLDDASMMAAVELVSGMLDGGLSRGSLALAVVDALHDIAMKGMDHPAYDGLGMSAMAFANKVEVASYHTLTRLMADPSAEAIAGVTDDAATVETAKQHIDSPPADAMFDMVGELSLHENADGSGMPGDDNGPIGVGHVTASDSNGDMVTYSIAGDPEDWAILEDGKLCYIGTGVDYEMGSSIDLEIVATSTGADGTETSVSQMVTVMVGDVQESDAEFNDVGTLSIEENQAMGMVGSVTAMDAEDDPVTYRLADGSHAGFSIDEMTGAISYEGDGLDYETTPTVDLTVIATSTGANNMATDVSQMVTVMVGDVDDLPDEPMQFTLTPTIDNVQGGDADDTIVATPEKGASLVFQDVLNPFDTIDGGGGTDTIHIFGVEPEEMLSLAAEDISNVENIVINTVGGIEADLRDWEGVSMVDLRRFGDESDVMVTVDDGATVSTSRTFGGKATIVGSMGAVNIEATDKSMVHIGSAGQTDSVMVKGGASILIDNGASSGDKQSQTVTSVSVDGVKAEHGDKVPGDLEDAPYTAMTDDNGYVVGQNGTTRVTVGEPAVQVSLGTGNVLLDASGGNSNGDPVTTTYSWDDDGDDDTDDIEVVVQLKFDVDNGGLAFGDIVSVGGESFAPDADAPVTKIEVRNGDEAKEIEADDLDGMRVPTGAVATNVAIGKSRDTDGIPEVDRGEMATLMIHSDSIETVNLHNTTAIALVYNNSKTDEGKAMPEDLAVTVDKYGSFNANGSVKQLGKLCIDGAGSAENIMIDVAGASAFNLASNKVKTLDISGDGKLVLDVNKFKEGVNDNGPSGTLESVTISGSGGVVMSTLQGMNKLKMIDASASSGDNHFKSSEDEDNELDAELDSLTMVMGGSGKDTVELTSSQRGKLESIHTGDGNDVVKMGGDYRDEGLMVDLGAGDDTFHGDEGNSESRIDGGDGRDTLRLSKDGATYKDGDDTVSIYANFEILDLGGGSGTYDVGRLGVDTLVVNKTTAGVVLKNVAGGTTLDVAAEKAGMGTTATVDYGFAEGVNAGGSLIDGGTSNVLNVSLMAKGGKPDTEEKQSGIVTLDIDLDDELRAMSIESNAAAGGKATAGNYQNNVDVTGNSSALEEVKITGNAQTKLSGGLNNLEYVNAAGSGGGVYVDATASVKELTLVGSQHDDVLMAGSFVLGSTGRSDLNTLLGRGGDDKLTTGAGGGALVGGAGEDTLTGGNSSSIGVDLFVYNAASESQVSFKRDPEDSLIKAEGYDTIVNFKAGGADKIMLSKPLWAIISAGGFKAFDQWGAGTGTTNGQLTGLGWNLVDDDGEASTPRLATTSIDGNKVGVGDGTSRDDSDTGATDLREFIGSGQGLFLTTVLDDSTISGRRQVKNSVAVIEQDLDGTEGDGLWVLFDVNADGDFDEDTDMVIFLAGTATDAFTGGDLISG